MLRPLSLLPALVVAVATTWGLTAPPATAAESAPRTGSKSARAAEPAAPLAVTIDSMSPATVPREGRITLRGTVTNVDEETWTSVALYPFRSLEPLTTRAEIAEAVASDPTEVVGERVLDEGPYALFDSLAPGQTRSYTIRVRSQDLDADASGVYWFGVHALGVSSTSPPGDGTADGRARTFLPRMTGSTRQVETALAVPLRTQVTYADDGSLADPEGWTETFSTGGRLDSAVDLGIAAGTRPLTWLIDPAIVDAAARLEAGNPARVLGATVDPEATEDPDATAADPEAPEATESPAPQPALPSTLETQAPEGDDDEDGQGEDPADADPPSEAETAAARAATSWLDRVRDALSSSDLLVLPYGDLDAAAAADHDPAAYASARERSGDVLQPWGLSTSPVLGSPTGYLDEQTIRMAAEDETLLGSDLMVPGRGHRTPTVVTVAGRRVVLASSATAAGGPGPDDRMAPVALRQRILAEAAVRRMTKDREPLVVVLPAGWDPDDPDEFFAGLEQSWLDLTTIRDVRSGRSTPIEPDELDYPGSQVRRELDSLDFDSASALSRTGSTLQNLLTRNDTVGHEVADQAYVGLSYGHRRDSVGVRAVNDRARSLLETQLRGVTIAGPPQVTLSSDRGSFSATLENTLDEPVTVRVRAVADEPISISMAEEDIELPPHSRRSVLLTASTQRQGIHNVTLQVTDLAGTTLGSSDGLPIRAAQVSGVIWLIIGIGAALLFGAIVVRLVRRVRAARRTPPEEPDQDAGDDPAADPSEREAVAPA